MKNTHIISAFAGSGKSYLAENNKDMKFLDLDSSNYPKEDFPSNYLRDIIKHTETHEYDYILISTHKEIRDALKDNDIKYALVFPHSEQGMRFTDIYTDRGSSKEFIDFMRKNYRDFVHDLFNDTYGFRNVIYSEETLADHIQNINSDFKLYDSLQVFKRFIENNKDNMDDYELEALQTVLKSTRVSGMVEC